MTISATSDGGFSTVFEADVTKTAEGAIIEQLGSQCQKAATSCLCNSTGASDNVPTQNLIHPDEILVEEFLKLVQRNTNGVAGILIQNWSFELIYMIFGTSRTNKAIAGLPAKNSISRKNRPSFI